MKKTIVILFLAMFLVSNLFANPLDLNMVPIPKKGIMMLRTEVTQALYETIMGSNPSYNVGDNLPVEEVSWYDALEFCNALSRKLGLSEVYTINGKKITKNTSANGFRLPTVEEWEYAARGGKKYTYSGSNNLDEVAWYSDNSGGKTHPVAQKKPNSYKLYDMSGNVWEWCEDWYAGDQFHMRGGCYDDGVLYTFYVDYIVQDHYGGDSRRNYIGFRIVRKAK
ncbi:MAG: SUMF1/EgtB/PvdO family nonheme iron enzyme [Spirochaetia bacterium]|nr:SUMF1/EgtB/PvdO family nonheme iron enzyme [Spirochaetia bacterium]